MEALRLFLTEEGAAPQLRSSCCIRILQLRLRFYGLAAEIELPNYWPLYFNNSIGQAIGLEETAYRVSVVLPTKC